VKQHLYNLMGISRAEERNVDGLWARCIGTDDPRLAK
jgi:hypothetical protein